MNKAKSVKILNIVINIFIGLLIAFVIGLPWMISWYVETMHRPATLAATVLVTCYPCAPFAAAALASLKKLVKVSAKNGPCNKECCDLLFRIAVCCIVIAVITVVAGKFYMPFWIVCATFTFVTLLVMALRTMLYTESEEENIEETDED